MTETEESNDVPESHWNYRLFRIEREDNGEKSTSYGVYTCFYENGEPKERGVAPTAMRSENPVDLQWIVVRAYEAFQDPTLDGETLQPIVEESLDCEDEIEGE